MRNLAELITRIKITTRTRIITIKKDTIMKAIELTPTTAANFDSTAMTTRVSNFKKAAKKFIKATCRFFVVISPAYPQYVESMQRKA